MKILLLSLILITSSLFAEEGSMEGVWVTCNSESDCEENKQTVYMFIDEKTMQVAVVIDNGTEGPTPVGKALSYKRKGNILEVTKKDSEEIDKYELSFEGDWMIMTYIVSGTKLYFKKATKV
jgi:hypothetical protein